MAGKHLLCKPEDLSSNRGPHAKAERTDSQKLPLDLYVCTVACARPLPTNLCKAEFKKPVVLEYTAHLNRPLWGTSSELSVCDPLWKRRKSAEHTEHCKLERKFSILAGSSPRLTAFLWKTSEKVRLCAATHWCHGDKWGGSPWAL